ncbi:MAG: CBS domain-containing protein [Chloroflexota bacterium]
MLVDEIMTRDVQTVAPVDRLGYAWELMQNGGFRHLPVVEGDRIVGIVSDRDVQLAIARAKGSVGETPNIGSIMWREPYVATPDMPVEEASQVMLSNSVGALPVVEDFRLVGIVSESDVLRLTVDLLGMAGPSVRVLLDLSDPGPQLEQVMALAHQHGIAVASLMSRGTEHGNRKVVLRLATDRADALLDDLAHMGVLGRTLTSV